jgi:NADPH-dependent curcumin reductase CurA
MPNRRILIDSLPTEALTVDNYRMEEAPIPELGDGDVLCRTLAISIDAGSRAGLQGSASYAGAPKTGVVMNGNTIARVETSLAADFQAGDLVSCGSGWQDYAVHPAKALSKLPAVTDPALYLGALGGTGLTAYFGLFKVGQPQSGETVVVSAAAGAVGHLVGQMARIHGCRAVGIAGSDEKCARLVDELGFAAAVNYKEDNFRQSLKESTPDGIDVYFDNTGGGILGNALFRMNLNGRIACCGVVSQYDTGNPDPGPRGVPGLLVNKRLRMEGFLVFDYLDEYPAAREAMSQWLDDGELIAWQDEFKDLESAPRALVDLLAGGNVGKRIVRVAE